MDPNDDLQLKALLREWNVPQAPSTLEIRLDRARRPWWQKVLTYSVPVPIPVAVGLALFLLYGAWRTTMAVPPPCAVSAAAAAAAVLHPNCGPGASC